MLRSCCHPTSRGASLALRSSTPSLRPQQQLRISSRARAAEAPAMSGEAAALIRDLNSSYERVHKSFEDNFWVRASASPHWPRVHGIPLHACMHACVRACVRACMRTRVPGRTCANACTQEPALCVLCVHACMRASIAAPTHTRMHRLPPQGLKL